MTWVPHPSTARRRREHVFGRPYERETDHVRTSDRKVQVRRVLLTQRRQAETTAVRKVNALVGAKSRTAGARLCDAYPQTIPGHFLAQDP